MDHVKPRPSPIFVDQLNRNAWEQPQPLSEPGSFPELGMLPTSEPFGPLNRLLKRAIKAMKETPDVAHFLEPVNKAIYPGNYHS